MPIGRSRWGFLASCAAVETASKPMYAKKMTPAPAAEGAVVGLHRLGDERLPVPRIDIRRAESDDEQDDRDLDDHDEVVHGRRLADADHQQTGEQRDQEYRGHVEDRARRDDVGGAFDREWCLRERGW